MHLQAQKLAESLAWHAVEYQNITTAENPEELEERARETLHQTTDSLAFVLPIAEQFRLAQELPKSELEDELPNKQDLNDLIRFLFVVRIQELAETEYLPAFVNERAENPKGLSKNLFEARA